MFLKLVFVLTILIGCSTAEVLVSVDLGLVGKVNVAGSVDGLNGTYVIGNGTQITITNDDVAKFLQSLSKGDKQPNNNAEKELLNDLVNSALKSVFDETIFSVKPLKEKNLPKTKNLDAAASTQQKRSIPYLMKSSAPDDYLSSSVSSLNAVNGQNTAQKSTNPPSKSALEAFAKLPIGIQGAINTIKKSAQTTVSSLLTSAEAQISSIEKSTMGQIDSLMRSAERQISELEQRFVNLR